MCESAKEWIILSMMLLCTVGNTIRIGKYNSAVIISNEKAITMCDSVLRLLSHLSLLKITVSVVKYVRTISAALCSVG